MVASHNCFADPQIKELGTIRTGSFVARWVATVALMEQASYAARSFHTEDPDVAGFPPTPYIIALPQSANYAVRKGAAKLEVRKCPA